LPVAGRMNQQYRATVPGQLLQTFGRLPGVQRQVDRAQFQHRQQADDPLHRAFLAQRNGHSGADILLLQVTRQPVGTAFQFIEVQALLPGPHRQLAASGIQTPAPEAEEVVTGKGRGLLDQQ
jgi:hypothetical protein